MLKKSIFHKLLNAKVSTKLKVGFSLVTALTLILGFISISRFIELSQLSEKMYKHPFAVSNTVRDINSNIIAMHRSMKDVALSNNEIELENAIVSVNSLEKKVMQNFDFVLERFLGDKSDVRNKYQMFIKWKEIRDEVITLVRSGKKSEAAMITKRKGALYVENLTHEMNSLIEFANNKADEFFKNSKKESKNAIYILVGLLTVILLLSIFISMKVTHDITSAITILSKGLNNFFLFLSGKSKKINPIVYRAQDEFGQIINVVNENIEVSAKLHTELNNLMRAVDKNIIISKTDPEGIITYVSQAFIDISGYRKDELIGQPHNIVRHPDSPSEQFRVLWKTIQSGQTWSGEVLNLKKDGEGIYWADTLITPERDIHGSISGYSAIKHDITSKKEVDIQREKLDKQNQMILTQAKVAAVGEMIGNIAHQWRQPLAAISAGLTSIQFSIDLNKKMSDEELLQIVHKVNNQCQYLSKTIEDFRDFFKLSSTNVTEFNLKEGIQRTSDLIKNTFENHNIKLILDVSNCTILVNENALIQSLINLFNNVKDAMVLNNIPMEKRYLFISMKKSKDEVVLSFKDSAGGIKKDAIDKIFEPYFTTKHQSKGTGLGLYMTHQIITKHLHGTIYAQNSSFEYNELKLYGADFKITLPIR